PDGGRHLDPSVATATVYRALASIAEPDLLANGTDSARFWRFLAEGRTGLAPAGGTEPDDDGPGTEARRRRATVERLLALPHRRKVTVDVLSGSSAGGLNALYLAKALVNDQDMARIKQLWVDQGGLGSLIDDERVGSAGSAATDNGAFQVAPTHFPASTLSGHWFYKSLFDALQLMNADGEERKPLVDALDAYLTTTDLRGIRRRIALDADSEVDELLHRVVGHLIFGRTYSTGGDRNDFDLDHFLAFLGRASAAHPAAFHPAQLREISGLVNGPSGETAHDGCSAGCTVEGHAFCPRDRRWSSILKPNHPESGVVDRWYSDGGDMDNKPFGYALAPVGLRRALRPVDRKLLYVEPSPGRLGEGWEATDRPTVARYVLDAWSLGRAEPIRHDIAEIEARNARIAGIRQNVTDQIERLQAGVVVGVDHASASEAPEPAPTGDEELDELKDVREEETRSWVDQAPAVPSSYERRRYEAVSDGLIDLIDRLSPLTDDPLTSQQIRATATRHLRRRYPLGATPEVPTGANHRTLLVDFDIGYRLRRLGLIDQLLADAQRLLARDPGLDDQPPSLATSLVAEVPRTERDYDQLRDAIIECRTELNRCFLKIRTYGRALRGSARDEEPSILGRQAEAIEQRMNDIRCSPIMANQELWRAAAEDRGQAGASAVPADIDIQPVLDVIRDCGRELLLETSVVSREAIAKLPDPFGQRLWACWDGYQDLDGLILTAWSDAQGEVDPVEVMRISPLDAQSLVSSDSDRKKIAGDAVSHFGGFFDARWRSLDLLWGRLDAAELLISNLLPIAPDLPDAERHHRRQVRDALVTEAQLAIIGDEPDAIGNLHRLATVEAAPEAPLSSERPEEALTYLRERFDVEHSLGADTDRVATKNDLVERLPRVIGRVLASQRVDRSAPPLAARVRSLSLGRSAQALAQLARPNTVVARVGRLIIRLIAAVAVVGMAVPLVLTAVSLVRGEGWTGAIVVASIVVLGLATAIIRWHGDRLLSLLFGLILLTASVGLPVWAFVAGGYDDQRAAAGVAALYFLASIGAAVLLAVGGTVDRAGLAAWIGVAAFVGGVVVVGFGVAHWWALVLLVIAAAGTAVIFVTVVVVLTRLGNAIDRIGEPAP
ncbi:MAG: patatin-like protein, partial [Actinomycetota bacterium]